MQHNGIQLSKVAARKEQDVAYVAAIAMKNISQKSAHFSASKNILHRPMNKERVLLRVAWELRSESQGPANVGITEAALKTTRILYLR